MARKRWVRRLVLPLTWVRDRLASRVSGVLAASLLTGAATGFGAASAAPIRMAITFDDLPAHSALPPGETRIDVANRIVAALKSAGAPEVYGFVNGVGEVREPASVGVLAAWRAAGFPLGNHTWSHLGLGASTLSQWEGEVVQNEPLLQAHMGAADWRWLRYPFLAEGDTPETRASARSFLAARGYRIAGVTMSFADYAFNEPYARCALKGDAATISRLEATYLAAAADEVDHARAMSQAALGRDIPYVLLMHLGAFDARMLPRLLALYKSRDITFVTLPQAEADPFYAPDLDLKSAAPDTLEGALTAKGLPIPARKVDIGWLDGACR